MKKSKTCQVFFLHLGNRKTKGQREKRKTSRKQTNSVKMRQIVRQKLLYTLCRHFEAKRKGGKEWQREEARGEGGNAV